VAIIETEKLILSARAFALLAAAFGANDSARDRSSSDWHTGEDNHRRRLHEEHVGSRCGSGDRPQNTSVEIKIARSAGRCSGAHNLPKASYAIRAGRARGQFMSEAKLFSGCNTVLENL
jgi:hypothetical protein